MIELISSSNMLLEAMEACHKTGMNYPPLYVTFCFMSQETQFAKIDFYFHGNYHSLRSASGVSLPHS